MNLLEAVFQSTQTIVFFTIAFASFVFLALSSLFGGHDHDHDVSHDVSHDHDADGAHEYSTVSFFSPKVLCIFFLTFGAAGGIASIHGTGPVWSSVIGLLSGLVIGFIALRALRVLYGQQANSLVTDSSFIGVTGQVVTRIPANGVGEVSFVAAGQSTTRLARSKGNKEVGVGMTVKITTVTGDALLVEPV